MLSEWLLSSIAPEAHTYITREGAPFGEQASYISRGAAYMQVPRSKSMKAHPMSGMARINLTFRRLDPQSAARAPSCKCGQKAVLKVLNPV